MVFDFNNMELAYKKVRKGKSKKPNHMKFMYYQEIYLGKLISELNNLNYEPRRMQKKEILYPKRRSARVPVIADKIVQHTICDDYIYPEMERVSIKESSACIKGRGTQYGGNLLKEHLRKYYRTYHTNHFYVLKCDIHSYFASIEHERLKRLLDKYITDPIVLYYAKKYIDLPDVPTGIPLGLQESHINSNFYLMELDYMIKYAYHIPCYGRYKDDFYIISNNKGELESLKKDIGFYLNRIHLEFNPKTAIQEDKFDFLGFEYRLTPTGKVIARLAKPKLKQHRRRIRKLLRQLKDGEIETQTIANYHQGWRTHASWGDCGALIRKEDQWLSEQLEGLGYKMVLKPAKRKPKRKQKNQIVVITRKDE